MTEYKNNKQQAPQELSSSSQLSVSRDQVDLKDLMSVIWRGKWIIIITTLLVTLMSLGLALYLPNEYKATAIVQPNESANGGQLASLAGQFGGLASLAGVNLDSGESSDAVIAMEVMRNWEFAEQFIKEHKIEVPLFAVKKWSPSSKKLIYDENIYSSSQKKWVREPPKGKTIEPTSWELYEEYKERVKINQDNGTGLISISVTYYSPSLAKEWVDLLIKNINKHMRMRALKEANQNVRYLEEQFEITPYTELRKMFGELIQEQYKTKMLAQVSDEYVFKTISAAKVPEERSKPSRFLIVLLGLLLGATLSVFFVLMSSVFTKNK